MHNKRQHISTQRTKRVHYLITPANKIGQLVNHQQNRAFMQMSGACDVCNSHLQGFIAICNATIGRKCQQFKDFDTSFKDLNTSRI